MKQFDKYCHAVKELFTTIIARIMIFFVMIFKWLKTQHGKLKNTDVNIIMKNVIIYGCIIFLTIIVAAYITVIGTYDMRVMAYVGGEAVGLVEKTYIMDNGVIRVDNDIAYEVGDYGGFDYGVKYKIVLTNSEKYLSDENCYDILSDINPHGRVNAAILYVDGELIGAARHEETISDALESIRVEKLYDSQLKDSSIMNLEIQNEIKVVYGKCLKNEILSYDDIYSYLIKSEKISEISILKREMFSEVEKCQIEYVDSNEVYTGTQLQVNEGSDGIINKLYEVVYYDDMIHEKKLISEETLVEAEPIIIYVGTKPTPPKESLGTFVWPLDEQWTYITSQYGEQRVEFDGDEYHYGIDIAADAEVYVYASDGGKVEYSDESRSYGNMVKISHKNSYTTYYAHLNERFVEAGEYVYQGQIIGTVGKTGIATAPHLHFEIRQYYTPLDPVEYFD